MRYYANGAASLCKFLQTFASFYKVCRVSSLARPNTWSDLETLTARHSALRVKSISAETVLCDSCHESFSLSLWRQATARGHWTATLQSKSTLRRSVRTTHGRADPRIGAYSANVSSLLLMSSITMGARVSARIRACPCGPRVV